MTHMTSPFASKTVPTHEPTIRRTKKDEIGTRKRGNP